MSEQFVDSFVEKLILLEEKMGSKIHHGVMPLPTKPVHDAIDIQHVAKQIAEFAGLSGFTFIIAIAKQKAKVGGHIDLSTPGKEVYVEVDSDMMKFPDAIAATLCHEVCHKWLQINGIRSMIEIDNEILTDITSVFLGFGKIMLNGCKSVNVRNEGEKIITETLTAGYLNQDQFAFVYRLICAMRSISSTAFMQGLNAGAAQAIKRCDRLWGQYYGERFHEKEIDPATPSNFRRQFISAQQIMAHLDKHAVYIKKSFCETIDAFLISGHKKLNSLMQKYGDTTQSNEPNPSLYFLRKIALETKIERLSEDIRSISQNAKGFLQHAKAIGRGLSRNRARFPPPSPAVLSIVTCPQDGTKMRLPENSADIIVSCPSCKYRFAYNTSPLSFTDPPQRKLTWWQKLQNPSKKV